ncbi:DUF1134 domain-containing protein [Novosphingobium sp. FSW06-99]|uniref:DUF1134 domain-containing protein n=1 Tax=Novosphingobium sp. FSW06-99 TaxID=1739113 RepID=UPI00076BF2DB|nr:DUF1134 domain-containing protein [Novosphingobium sp. FSW06-99]KUR74885.1 hypothetical protein AQZ49_16615 [Novosphingobium sp. FSW06-99]
MIERSTPWLRALPIAAAAIAVLAAPVARAQVQTIDPNTAIDSDLNRGPANAPAPVAPSPPPAAAPVAPPPGAPPMAAPAGAPGYGPVGGPTAAPPPGDTTYHENELVDAAEGVFGKGARGLALMIRDLLKKQGEPDGYITGTEGGGAVIVGLRYGSGTLHQKIEGAMPVYWTGPSIGLDFGGNVASTFVLIYNLHDTETLFHRIGAGEGQAYLVGGFNVSYLRRGDLVVIPVRMGGGLRLGVNAGYMNFTHKQKWVPF